MSGRGWYDSPNRRASRTVTFVLAAGLVAAAGLFGARPGAAQSPGIDDRSPLPPGDAKRVALAEKFRFPNPKSRIVTGTLDPKTGARVANTGIVDFEPAASEKDNSDEYQAWTDVVRWAKQFNAADLEEYASRELTRDDLTSPSSCSLYRLDLVRFEGKLTKARRLTATRALRELGTAEVYEALLVPFDDPPADVVSAVFTELPEGLAELAGKPVEEWVEVNAPATAAGYFFKVKQDRGDVPVPVIVGKSVTLTKGPPPPGKNPAALDKNLRVFRFVKDDAFMGRGDDPWEEVAARDRVLLHARRFAPEELEKYARTDLSFADLFREGRRDYKLDLVKFEGRLRMLRKQEPSKKLRDAGLEAAYEGWMAPKDELHPICVVFTDPPEGVEPTGQVNKWVSFAGYSFKLLRYESSEHDQKDPKKNVVRRAPLLLGRAITVLPDPEGSAPVTWDGFLKTATVVVFVLLGTALGLAWWFRHGDRRTRQEITVHRSRNPFGEQTG